MLVNPPSMDFGHIIARISDFIESYGNIMVAQESTNSLFDCSLNEIAVLTSKLELEKDLRSRELGRSFISKDSVDDEK